MFGLMVWLCVPGTSASTAELKACRALPDDDRLACYDAAVDGQFGKPVVRPPREAMPELVQTVTSVSLDPRGRLRLTLENDQVWAQTDRNRLSLRVGDRIVIRQGFGGSFYLAKQSGSRSLKVRRLD